MTKVEIRSDSRYPVDRKRIRSGVERSVLKEGISTAVTVSVAVVGDRQMRTLNRQFHDTDATTDVLSFPYIDPLSSKDTGQFVTPESEGIILGDIVIAYPMAVKQAREKGILVDEEIDFLIHHGMQHLLGHHHT